jgi:hypothetical protein
VRRFCEVSGAARGSAIDGAVIELPKISQTVAHAPQPKLEKWKVKSQELRQVIVAIAAIQSLAISHRHGLNPKPHVLPSQISFALNQLFECDNAIDELTDFTEFRNPALSILPLETAHHFEVPRTSLLLKIEELECDDEELALEAGQVTTTSEQSHQSNSCPLLQSHFLMRLIKS